MEENDKYYESLKSESYKALRDAEVQASIQKDQARKYAQDSLRASGYGTQGMSESANAAIENQYLASMRNAQNTYNETLNQIGIQQEQDRINQANSDFQSLTTLLNNASSTEQLNNILSRYDITVDNGNFTFGEGAKNFSDSDRRQIAALYGLFNDNFTAEPTYTPADISGGKFDYAYDKNGKIKDQPSAPFELELRTLRNGLAYGEISDGDVIRIDNQNHQDVVYIMIKNGQAYYVSKSIYDNSKNKKYIYYNEGIKVAN